MDKQPNNPLHGKRLDTIIEELLDYYGSWTALGQEVRINCFVDNPSLKSSLTFLRKTPWARKKVEDLYIELLGK
ncbi:VF530 family protein [Sphingobacterium haloxyli]|uniref:Transporter n=1 Tax=Sphingobacterium haloxyli TaxID=2100533 RepID=A0A2S9J7D4_9SPHI|nr:VF530 family protein [Sphingobacterium haloxyli]PRD48695.1 transporter [Sphingobacterium haloxyli]